LPREERVMVRGFRQKLRKKKMRKEKGKSTFLEAAHGDVAKKLEKLKRTNLARPYTVGVRGRES